MIIKTITCHDVYNAGASLQAYALATYLKSLGHEIEIIDYKPEYLNGHYRLWGGAYGIFDRPVLRELYSLSKFPRRFISRMGMRKRNFDRFKIRYLPLTEIRYRSNCDLKQNTPVADVYFAGSDQIWNTLYPNGRDPAFYLDFVPEGRTRASYAASFATQEVAQEYREQMKIWLAKMDYISVREKSAIRVLELLGRIDGKQVMDPVFLLGKEHWKKIESAIDVRIPYIFLYDFDQNDAAGRFACEVAKLNKWKIYSFFKSKYADKTISWAGPAEFLSLIENAELIISNSFHATAFSIIFEKQFVSFDRNEGINSRIHDLLNIMDIPYADITSNPYAAKYIDYTGIACNRERLTRVSKAYIDQVLSIGGKHEKDNTICN